MMDEIIYTLHVYALDIFYIIDVPHETDRTTLVHVLTEENICADFMENERPHSKCHVYFFFLKRTFY
jgi:hypothetical protein